MLEFQIRRNQTLIKVSIIGEPHWSCENKYCFAQDSSLINNFPEICVAPWVGCIGGQVDAMS